MPVPVSRITKMSTPRIDLPAGNYPGHIVAMLYPKETNGECRLTFGEYLLQLHHQGNVTYVATRAFDISINSDSPMCALLCGLSGAENSEALYKWLESNGYFSNGVFDECAFLGSPVMATVERLVKNDASNVTYNVVSALSPLPENETVELRSDRLIPYSFAKPSRFVIRKLDGFALAEA